MVVDQQLLPQYMMAMFYKRYFEVDKMICIILVEYCLFIYVSYALVMKIWDNQRINVSDLCFHVRLLYLLLLVENISLIVC